VDENTKNIILEVGTWDMNTIRRTSMAYGLFTDASTRYTKGQSPLQNRAVIAKMAEDILRFAGGRVCGELIDHNNLPEEVLHRGSLHEPVETNLGFINERLGLSLNSDEVRRTLTNVEFKVEATGEKLKITAPFWRTDIEIAEDVVEEVGRLYGYDKLPLELPKRDLTPAEVNATLAFKSRLREILTKTGANEVLTYSFVHGNMLEKAGQNKDLAFKLNNAISPDLHYYRLSLTPSLLEKVHPNIKAGYNEFAIYEINKVHIKGFVDEEGLPMEFERLALIFAANKKSSIQNSGAPYYYAKKYLDHLLSRLGIENVSFEPIDPNDSDIATKYYEPGRSATIKSDNDIIGRIGEYKASVRSSLKLPGFSAGFELGIGKLLELAKPHSMYRPLNRFPSLEQDMTLRTVAKTTYAKMEEFMRKQLDDASKEHGYNYNLMPLDIFQKEDDKEHKQTSWRIKLAHPERTLTTEESNKLLDKIANESIKEINSERI
jgi:phenylalanyl-tRNA synthetase beta chain